MNPSTKTYLLKAYDLLIMVGTFLVIALEAQPQMTMYSLSDFLAIRLSIENFVVFVALLFLWHLDFSFFGLYESKRLATQWNKECFDILKATALGTLIIMVFAAVFGITIVSSTFLASFWIVVSTATIAGRLIARYIQRRTRLSGRNLKHTVIVGTNQRAMQVAEKIQSNNKELGYHLNGFVDDWWHQYVDRPDVPQHSLVSDLDGFQSYLEDHVVDEVIICAPVKSLYEKVSRIIAQCEEQGITVRIISNIYTPTIGRVHVDQLGDQHVVTMTVTPKSTGALFTKRMIDFSVASALLVLLSPFLCFVALFIKATSPGPVLFVQERVGLNKRRFRLYKFRTMVADAEKQLATLEHLNEVVGPVFKIVEDPRVTPLGRFLRKLSIDELPQLLNVLAGDMSLVGPRPLPVRDYEGFNQHFHRRRLSVRPGITGLWQVGGRSSVPFDQWMELDLQYIDRWSLWLDLMILLKTIPAVVRGVGAS